MNTFEPIREFFYRHHEKNLNEKFQSLHLEMCRQIKKRSYELAIYVGVDCLEDIYIKGELVGYVDYSINPLEDLLHINMIKIRSEHRHRRIALSVLWRLWQTYQMPITPLHFYPSSEPFWRRVSEHFAAAGALDLNTVRYTDEQLVLWRMRQHYANQSHEKLVRQLKLKLQLL